MLSSTRALSDYERFLLVCCGRGRGVPGSASSSWRLLWGGPSADCVTHPNEPTNTERSKK